MGDATHHALARPGVEVGFAAAPEMALANGTALPDVGASAEEGTQTLSPARRRTIDVTTGAARFDELLLPAWLLRGLASGGFMRWVLCTIFYTRNNQQAHGS